jgi:hypothetical protein
VLMRPNREGMELSRQTLFLTLVQKPGPLGR